MEEGEQERRPHGNVVEEEDGGEEDEAEDDQQAFTCTMSNLVTFMVSLAIKTEGWQQALWFGYKAAFPANRCEHLSALMQAVVERVFSTFEH